MTELPVVDMCGVDRCAYNRDRSCHAFAITVGDSRHPHCDTFTGTSMKGGSSTAVGYVGACKMADCRHNVDLACQAPGITVGYQESDIDCLTYQPA